MDREHDHQVAVMKWASLHLTTWPELRLLHAIPNGGMRDRVTAMRLRAEGVKPGVPDLFLPCARAGFHGLYIEMKRPGGRTTKLQDAFIEGLREQGYRVEVCHGWEAATEVLDEYLKSK